MVKNDVKVLENGRVTGTLLHVTGYTGFNEEKPEEQSGYYLPFKLTKTGEKMTFKKNGRTVKKDIPWESESVLRVTQSDRFTIEVDGAAVVTFIFSDTVFE